MPWGPATLPITTNIRGDVAYYRYLQYDRVTFGKKLTSWMTCKYW